MEFITLCGAHFIILFIVIALTCYMLNKFCSVKNLLPLGFGLGHFIFMFFIYIRIVFFPNFQEWGELFIVVLDFPVSIFVINLALGLENIKYLRLINPVFLYVLFGSVQYYLLGILFEKMYRFVRKIRGKKKIGADSENN